MLCPKEILDIIEMNLKGMRFESKKINREGSERLESFGGRLSSVPKRKGDI